jgi:hypothetical protein
MLFPSATPCDSIAPANIAGFILPRPEGLGTQQYSIQDLVVDPEMPQLDTAIHMIGFQSGRLFCEWFTSKS